MSAAQIFSILYRLKFLLSEGTLSPNIIHMKFAKFPYFPFAFFCVSAALAAPERIVFDTDMGNGADDALRRFFVDREPDFSIIIPI